MTVIFCLPLSVIALWESLVENGLGKNKYVATWMSPLDGDEDDNADVRDPKVNDDEQEEDDRGMQISKVPFDELTKVFPNATLVRILCLHMSCNS